MPKLDPGRRVCLPCGGGFAVPLHAVASHAAHGPKHLEGREGRGRPIGKARAVDGRHLAGGAPRFHHVLPPRGTPAGGAVAACRSRSREQGDTARTRASQGQARHGTTTTSTANHQGAGCVTWPASHPMPRRALSLLSACEGRGGWSLECCWSSRAIQVRAKLEDFRIQRKRKPGLGN